VDRLRIGTLGAARITRQALIAPSRELPEVQVTAVAARNRADAEAFASEHGIPVVHDSYEALLADPDLDAVYNPLPNSLHGLWTLRAIAAGKHVLCEKPFTSNAAEAREVADAARQAPVVVMEAMHYRYHLLAEKMTSGVRLIAGADSVGQPAIKHIHCVVSFPLKSRSDIRYRYELGGGATMDAGCYALDLIRLLGPGEPEVTSAFCTVEQAGVDQAMTAFLTFAGGATAWLDMCFDPPDHTFRADVHVIGEGGQMRVQNFIHPHNGYQFESRPTDRATPPGQEPAPGTPAPPLDTRLTKTTYLGQLEAFAAAVLRGQPFPTTAEHAVVTMKLIDDIYRAAGLSLRPSAQRPG
jgi:predicted dehydrogenase